MTKLLIIRITGELEIIIASRPPLRTAQQSASAYKCAMIPLDDNGVGLRDSSGPFTVSPLLRASPNTIQRRAVAMAIEIPCHSQR